MLAISMFVRPPPHPYGKRECPLDAFLFRGMLEHMYVDICICVCQTRDERGMGGIFNIHTFIHIIDKEGENILLSILPPARSPF